MRTYNIIVLISTAILIATVVTIIFAIAVYIISRTKRRKMREREESKSGATENIIITGSEFTKEYSTEDNTRQVAAFDGPKILKLYDPYKKEENRKNGSEER